MKHLSQSRRRILAGRYVQKYLKLARKKPRKVGLRILKRGYWKKCPPDQATDQVKKLIRRIDAGLDYRKLKGSNKIRMRTPRKKTVAGGGFFPDNAFKPENADKEWKQKDKDRMLNLIFAGQTFIALSQKMKRTENSIKRQFDVLKDNEAFAAEKYQPGPTRKSRAKKARYQPAERIIINRHTALNIPIAVTAKILQRPNKKVAKQAKEQAKEEDRQRAKLEAQLKISPMKAVAVSLDQIVAHCYLRRFANLKILSDKEYAVAVDEEIEFGGAKAKEAILSAERCPHVCDIPPHIRDLAYYLQYKFHETTGKWDGHVHMPYDNMLHAEKHHPEAVVARKKWSKEQKKK